MIHLANRADIARASMLDLHPQLKALLADRIAALSTPTYDLTDSTEYLIIDGSGATEAEIIHHVGFSPLVEPIDGARFGSPDFHPYWDYLAEHEGAFELIFSVTNSGFAYVLLVQDSEGVLPELLALCRHYA